MSLLNDALRGAEQQRKNDRPAAPAAYVGQGAAAGSQSPERSPWGWLIVIIVMAALAAVAAIYWLQSTTPASATNTVSTEPAAAVQNNAVSDPEPRRVERLVEAPAAQPEVEASASPSAEAEQPPNTESTATPAEPDNRSLEEELRAQEATVSTRPEADQPVPAEAAPPEQQAQTSSREPAAEPPSQTTTAQAAPPASENAEAQAAPTPESAPEQAVKQQKETPELVDRRTESDIRTLLSRGQVSAAAQTLADLLRAQPAPRSRARFARYLIVQDRPEQALDWLPLDTTRADSSLRLLRARALLAGGQAAQALATLESEVPSVRQSAEYTVTLATLLQQQGRSNAAVTRWAELIEYDSTKGPWWVGLAIALEADRQPAGALRACQQAIRLPGLARSLEDYCRQRVSALRAG